MISGLAIPLIVIIFWKSWYLWGSKFSCSLSVDLHQKMKSLKWTTYTTQGIKKLKGQTIRKSLFFRQVDMFGILMKCSPAQTEKVMRVKKTR